MSSFTTDDVSVKYDADWDEYVIRCAGQIRCTSDVESALQEAKEFVRRYATEGKIFCCVSTKLALKRQGLVIPK